MQHQSQFRRGSKITSSLDIKLKDGNKRSDTRPFQAHEDDDRPELQQISLGNHSFMLEPSDRSNNPSENMA